MAKAAVAVVVAAVAVALTAGCDLETDSGGNRSGEATPSTATTAASGEAAKSGDGTERHDLEPLVTRIPALDGAIDATWFSGTLGTGDAPGPSLYWIDAVVTLPAGEGDRLRGTLDLAPADAPPDVVDALAPALPTGDLLAGTALDAAFSHEHWRTTAYLAPSGDAVVLVVVGE